MESDSPWNHTVMMQGAMEMSYNLGKFHWMFGKALSLTVKVETTGAGGAEALWSGCPWRQGKPTGHGCEEPALTRRALCRRGDCWTSAGPFLPVRFCDSLILQ